MSDIKHLQEEVVAWADSIFPHRTIHSAALKLYEEIGEMLRDPHSADEHADIYIMMLDISSMYGVDVEEAVRQKLEINRQRAWKLTELGTLKHTPND